MFMSEIMGLKANAEIAMRIITDGFYTEGDVKTWKQVYEACCHFTANMEQLAAEGKFVLPRLIMLRAQPVIWELAKAEERGCWANDTLAFFTLELSQIWANALRRGLFDRHFGINAALLDEAWVDIPTVMRKHLEFDPAAQVRVAE